MQIAQLIVKNSQLDAVESSVGRTDTLLNDNNQEESSNV